MKRILALLCALSLCCSFACAEEDDFSLDDIMEWDEEITYDDVAWNFPIDIYELDAEKIVLANKHMLLEKTFVPAPLVTMKTRKVSGGKSNGGVRKASSSEMQLQKDCAEALVALCEAAEADGVKLYLKSAYRSWSTQKTMYANRLAKYGYDDGWVSQPGASDHQTGLGCDVVPYKWTDKGMNDKMASEPECIWMAAHCAEYGFVIRYPKDKVDVTEINYEPWHLRYVGNPAATYIMENGLCLEEFHEQLMAAVDEFIADGGRKALVDKLIQVSAENGY